MKIHELQLAGNKDTKRVGRGIGSGYGKTAGRGTKGQNSRTGGGVRVGFEGGQNPLAKRLPKKRGFAPLNRTEYQVVNLDQLETFKANAKVGLDELMAAGFVKKAGEPVKILAKGELTKKLSLTAHSVSKTALASIEKAGGTVTVIELAKSPKKATRPQEATV